MTRHTAPFGSLEDYLDWVENQRRPRAELTRVDAALIGASFLGTSVWILAGLALFSGAGFAAQLKHLFRA